MLVVVCLLAWGPALLAPASRFWDDWVILGGGAAGLYRDVGVPWMGIPVHVLVGLGAWSFKVTAILASVVTALAGRRVAESGLGFQPAEAWFLAALVTVLPFNAARSSVAILLTYTLSLAAFMVAWALLVTPTDGRPRRAAAIGAAALFLLSFGTASLIVFFALPIAHLAKRYAHPESPLLPQAVGFARTYWFLLAAPFAFWVVRSVLLRPSGLYASYNTFVLSRQTLLLILLMLWLLALGLLALVASSIAHHDTRFGGVPRVSAVLAGVTVITLAVAMYVGGASHSGSGLLVSGLVLVAGALVLTDPARDARVLAPTGMGLIASGLAALPYLLVGKVPAFTAWDNRHQLLLSFGGALVVVAAARAAEPAVGRRVARTALAAVVVASTLMAAAGCVALVVDWHKQAQVIDRLRHEPRVRGASTVVVTDGTRSWNYDDRAPRFYEYTGWLREAFGGQSRLGVADDDLPAWRAGQNDRLLTSAGRFGLEDWDRKGRTVAVRIDARPGSSWWSLLLDRPSVELVVRPLRTP